MKDIEGSFFLRVVDKSQINCHGTSVILLVLFYSLLSQEQKLTGIEIILLFSWKGESAVLQGEEKHVNSSGFQEQDVKEVGDELEDGTEETAKPLRKIARFPQWRVLALLFYQVNKVFLHLLRIELVLNRQYGCFLFMFRSRHYKGDREGIPQKHPIP